MVNRLKILLFFLLSYPFVLFSEEIICSGHPDYPPVMWRDGDTIVGAGVELVSMILKELKQDFKVNYTGPWNRVQANSQQGTVDIIVGAYSNDVRRSYMDYSDSYLMDPTSIIVKKGNKFIYKSRESLVNKKGVTIYGDSFGKELDQFIKEKLHLTRVYEVESMFKHLKDGNVDYILWGLYPAKIQAAKLGFSNEIEVLEESVVDEGMYITISKKSKFLHLLPKINKVLKRLKKDGTVERLVEKYLNKYIEERARNVVKKVDEKEK